MKTTNAERVVNAWKHGNSAHDKTIRTDGSNLYSYQLLIGYTAYILPTERVPTFNNGDKVVLDYTKTGENFVSQTTSAHVGVAKKYADMIVNAPPMIHRS